MNNFNNIVMGSIDIAQTTALKYKNTQLDSLHLLYGLIVNPQTFSSRELKKYKDTVLKEIKNLPQASNSIPIDQIRPSAKFSEWITHASSQAIQDGRSEIKESDLLIFMPKVIPPSLNIDYSLLNNKTSNEESECPNFLINLNELAAKGKLDPVIGRTKEIRSLMEILGRRGKNNPVLVGPAGVGKTAIIEGLAEAIHKGNVPEMLKGKTVLSLEMGSLVAGTKFRGDFEDRMQSLIKYIKEQNGEVILFIDEIHQLVGAGKTEGAMDAANLLKPALARGELHCIGATTPNEYQKYILGDSALDRRFRPVYVNEPTKEDSIEILMGLREKFEIHHGIKISNEAIYSSVMLSDQYITDKNLPDKAIDLIDEAASSLKIAAKAMPSKLIELESEIRSKKILAQVQKKDVAFTREIESLEKIFNDEKKQWEQDILSLKRVSELKNSIDRLKFEQSLAERNHNYELAGKIKYSTIPELQKELEKTSCDWVLKEKEIAAVISRQTGIPEDKILKNKQDKILGLESALRKRVQGQDHAIHEIAETLIASHAGLSDPTRPMGSFLLAGPSGVGKTETAKSLTEYLFDTEKNLIRLDMSEYSEKHSVAKLIGAPAGYIGYDEGGILTEAVRTKPYSVILFDEIEKAHYDFSDILLQILDDGRLTDNKGRTINFKNCIIILTTNSKNIETDFKPEVLGRLDAILTYNSLNESIMQQLVKNQIALLNKRLNSKNIILDIDASATMELGKLGYNPKYGARPLNTVFNKLVTRPLSKEIIKGEFNNMAIHGVWKNGEVQFN